MPLGSLYNLIVGARARLFARGILRSHDLGVPVISVGNITVGGTGKTPLVAFVAKVLADEGRNVCILTRGYKRANPRERVVVSDGKNILSDAASSGDEPFELANKLIGISAVIADKNRAAAGRWAKENLGCNAFVLDDGFQHLKLKRDLDLVTIDAMNPFGNGKLLPQGILREPPQSLKRAQAVIVTRANLSSDVALLETKLAETAPGVPIFIAYNHTASAAPLADFFDREPSKLSVRDLPEKAVAFCALGNPDNFFQQLRLNGFDLTQTKAFPDHHRYGQNDVAELEDLARQNSVELLLTTAKDAVKLSSLNFESACYVIESELRLKNETGLRDLITQALRQKNK